MTLTRQRMWESLGEPVDVLVVGGGINGAGIARDAARRGLSVAMVEARDLAYGTSSRSSKLVHGGLRYLEQLEFSLVFEAVSERRILMDIAPHLVRPLGFLFPIYSDSRHNLATIKTGLWLYEGLSLFRSPKRHRRLSAQDVADAEPVLRSDQLEGAPLYYDCSTDDARLTLESALDAADHGATVATWARATSFLRDEETGRINGAVVQDTLGDEGTREVRANAVVNATGPWVDRTREMASRGETRERLRPTKGVHIVVDRDRLPVENAVVCFHPDDERVLFAIPWGQRTYLGTTDTDYRGDPGEVRADAEDVHYLIAAANDYFPDIDLEPDDVMATWAGLRPLITPEGQDEDEELSESDVSREHEIIIDQDGLITIAGGKLTTYRRMSAEVVDNVVKLLRLAGELPENLKEAQTDRQPLPGARGWPEGDDTEVFHNLKNRTVEASDDVLDEPTAGFLVYSYGMRAPELARLVADDAGLAEPITEGRPEILAQIDWGVTQELAATVTDILLQRTQIYYKAEDQGVGAVRRVAQHMAELLDWDDQTVDEQIERYCRDVELSRRWQQEYEQGEYGDGSAV